MRQKIIQDKSHWRIGVANTLLSLFLGMAGYALARFIRVCWSGVDSRSSRCFYSMQMFKKLVLGFNLPLAQLNAAYPSHYFSDLPNGFSRHALLSE